MRDRSHRHWSGAPCARHSCREVTFYKREWDTWYQAEIAGKYNKFNSHQITQNAELRAFPRDNWATTVYDYRHDLEQPQCLDTPLSSRAWADEVNLSLEYFGGDRFYGYAGLAWSRPDRGAREFFGANGDCTVVQTCLIRTLCADARAAPRGSLSCPPVA